MTTHADNLAFMARMTQEVADLLDDARRRVRDGTDPLEAAAAAVVAGHPRQALAAAVLGVVSAITPIPEPTGDRPVH